jgi:hypothetical protein
VHHAGAVGGAQGTEDLESDVDNPGGWQGAVLVDHLVQRPRRHVLHDDPRMHVGADDVVDADDAGVAEPCGRARLAQGTGAHLVALLRSQARRQHDLFDGDVPVQHLVSRQPDAAHAALAERPDKSVALGEKGLRDRHPEEHTRSDNRHARAPLFQRSVSGGLTP